MNDGLSRLYHVDEQREKKNHVSEIKVAIFQTQFQLFTVTPYKAVKHFLKRSEQSLTKTRNMV